MTHLNIALLTEHFEDLQNVLSLLKHFFDIIGISEHEINKNSMDVNFTLPGYTFYFNETKSSRGGTGFFISVNSTFKQRPGRLLNEPGRLESAFIKLIFPNKRNMICGCIYNHLSIKISSFNSDYLTLLVTNIKIEEKHVR